MSAQAWPEPKVEEPKTFFVAPPKVENLSGTEITELLKEHTAGIDRSLNSITQSRRSDIAIIKALSRSGVLIIICGFFILLSPKDQSIRNLNEYPHFLFLIISLIILFGVLYGSVVKKETFLSKNNPSDLLVGNFYFYINEIKKLVDIGITWHEHKVMPDAEKYLLGLRLVEAELALKRAQAYLDATK
jgi:hypothetical protein